ncbi:MAG: hypothetical protein JETCAE02_03900 [Anaerolineaceae bacterium]|nr:hypothetical protein [Anaerolineae bacterium]MBV6466796.1 hypothetical protein [Anaerolineales bacterium]MDL1926141.1 hypothetical protein [Anaerolineae bacterium AMX1]NOG75683.1 hypothetical protein [Chloroflexota bacterium]GER81248.1 conserved hypothetical protein [Candidatus Denitrolinea symbiosum]GJQ37978.1 MAG: hypothetical protein JETCAE02_03900 [Anaerolineaceae bacterium]
MRKLLPLILGLVVLLSACGPKATPTIDAASVQASAVAMAYTMAAQTQAAVPTATNTQPPTETPVPPTPTFALPSFPTLDLPTATQAAASGQGPCYHSMMPDPPGQKFKLRVWNTNKAPVNGNVCLYQDRGHGVTGVIGISLGRNADTFLTVPQGCYSAFFWVNDPKTPTQASGSGLCANNSDKWTIKIGATTVTMLPP